MSKQAVLLQPRLARTTLRFEPTAAPGVGRLLVLHPDVDAWAMRAANASGFGGDSMPGALLRTARPAVAAPAPRQAPRDSRPLRRLRALLRWFGRRVRQRRALRELESLDTETLRDLGVHRSEIGSVWAERIGLAMASRRRIADNEDVRLRAGLPVGTHAQL